ncbi:hypothetical protein GE061_013022 [Apolygus lucorum]|uniref:Uncharacterized protein n=1 Tax=Apolygus lucorum TaxID=248454 RepID=A0A6A4JX89_APOLU|nr:hypothetical protein GE061_013022 [Apolygus lucorum]
MIDSRTISGLSLLLLSYLVTLGPALKCYECKSSTEDEEPTCDRLYWKQLDTDKWANLSVDCIEQMSTFCVVTWKILDTGGKQTERGCMGKTDSQGTTLNAGCIDISDTEKTCLCTDNFCNASPDTTSPFRRVLSSFIPLILTFLFNS